MNDCISQGANIQFKILHSPLLITDFPTIHGRLLANVRAFRSVLPLLFPNGLAGPPSAFQAA